MTSSLFNNSIFRIRSISFRDCCEDRCPVRPTILPRIILTILRLDGYLEAIGAAQLTPVVAVSAYTMQHTEQINSRKRKKGV